MKPISLQGYTIALGYLVEYETENELKGDLQMVKFLLQNLVFVKTTKESRSKKQDVKTIMLSLAKKGYDKIVEITKNDEVEVSCLKFCLQLITKNPNKDKNKELSFLALKLERDNMFSRDLDMINARMVVNKFYGLTK